MEIKKLAQMGIQHFQEVGFYSEIDDEKLEKIFEKFLQQVWDKKIQLLSLRVEIDKQNGEPWTVAQYKEEFNTLQSEMSGVLKQLLANKTVEPQSLNDNTTK